MLCSTPVWSVKECLVGFDAGFGIATLMSVIWMVIGYSIAFGDGNTWWGGLESSFAGIPVTRLAAPSRERLFMFQMTFAIITLALIVSAVERIKFSAVLWFSGL